MMKAVLSLQLTKHFAILKMISCKFISRRDSGDPNQALDAIGKLIRQCNIESCHLQAFHKKCFIFWKYIKPHNFFFSFFYGQLEVKKGFKPRSVVRHPDFTNLES